MRIAVNSQHMRRNWICNIRVYPEIGTGAATFTLPPPTSQFSSYEPVTQGGKRIHIQKIRLSGAKKLFLF